MNGTGAIDRFLDVFTRYIDSGFGLLGGEEIAEPRPFQDRTIVGVVGNVKVRGLERRSEPQVYLLQIETGQRELVGNFPGMTLAPRFSPDGQKVVMSLLRDDLRVDPMLLADGTYYVDCVRR